MLDVQALADRVVSGRSLRCWSCGGGMSALPSGGRLGVSVYVVVCNYCAASVRIEVEDAGGAARSVGFGGDEVAGPCVYPECGVVSESNGLCSGHRSLWVKAARPKYVKKWAERHHARAQGAKPDRKPLAARVACRVAGCGSLTYGSSVLCAKHYQRYRGCDEPGMDKWLALGGPTPKAWRTVV